MQKILLSNYNHSKVIKDKKLDYVFIKLNTTCNAKCGFCDCWKTKKHTFAIDYLSLADQLLKIRPQEINLSGGEVFLAPEFWPLLEKINGELNWSITTNGSLLRKETIDRLVSLNVRRLFISIDSVYDVDHNASRGIQRLLAKINSSIDYITTHYSEIDIIVNHVVTKLNSGQIKDFLLFYQEKKVKSINLIPIKDTSNLYLNVDEITSFYEEIKQLLEDELIVQEFFINKNYYIFGRSEKDFLLHRKGSIHLVKPIV